jgi:CIC family chloride channel protein
LDPDNTGEKNPLSCDFIGHLRAATWDLGLRAGQSAERLYRRIYPFFAPSETKYLVVLAILIGLVTAAAAYFLDGLINWIFVHSLGARSGSLLGLPLGNRWAVVLIPALGGLAVGPMIYYLSPESKGHGVPEVMAAVSQKGGIIRGRVALLKALSSSLTIGTGGSAGREGPIVQIGAAIGSWMSQLLKVPPVIRGSMVASGAAAGIAAAFNAPLGGMCFAIEVILGEITAGPFAMVVLSTVLAATVSRGLHGDRAYFQVPAYHLAHNWELGLYLILGLAAGVVGKLFVRVLYGVEDAFEAWKPVHERWKPAVGGFLLGALALFLPGVMGTGNDVIALALRDQLPLLIVGLLVFGKILATSLTIGSGGSGGIFMPSLFIGAMLGSTLGKYFAFAFPQAIDPGAYAMVGMAAVFAAATHAPLTAILILFEMTYDYAIILPVMTATVSAVLVARVIDPETIYTHKLLRKGISPRKPPQPLVLENTLVEAVMAHKVETLPADLPLNKAIRHFDKSRHSGFPVVDAQGRLQGMLSYVEIRAAYNHEPPPDPSAPIRSVARLRPPRVYPDDTVARAVRLMFQEDIDRLPVVERENPDRLLGLLCQGDVVGLYGKRLDSTAGKA